MDYDESIDLGKEENDFKRESKKNNLEKYKKRGSILGILQE